MSDTPSDTESDAADKPDGEEARDFSLRETMRVLMGASRGFWLVNWINFCDGIAYFGFIALLAVYMGQNVGFSTGMAPFSVAMFSGGVTIFMAVGGGSICDWLGVRRALTLAVGVILIGRIMLTLSPHGTSATMIGATAWVSLLVMAFGEGVLQPALYAGVKQYTDKRTATMGYAFLYSIMNLGIVAGEFLSPVLRRWYASSVEGLDVSEVPRAGISGAFWFFIAVTAIMLAVHVTFFTRKIEARDRVIGPEPEPEKKVRVSASEYLRSLPILDARFMFFICILLPVRFLFAHQFLTMPEYVMRAFPAEVGARWEHIYLINPAVIVLCVPIFAALTLKRRVVDMMILGTLVSAASTVFLMGEPRLEMLIAYVVMFSIGEALWTSRFLEYVAQIAPSGRVGIYMGVAGIPWFAAKLITGLYAGYMIARFIPEQPKHLWAEILGDNLPAVAQAPGTMWMIYGAVATVTPIALVLARPWLLRGELTAGSE